MTRNRFGAVLLFVSAAATAASAQPNKPPGAIEFKQFGATPEEFFKSSVTRWTGQLALDLEAIKAEVAAANVPPAVRAGLVAQVDAVLRETGELDQQVRRAAPREKLFAGYAAVEKTFVQLVAGLNQTPAARQASASALSRADGAFHQLANALGRGDNDPVRVKRRLFRLGDVIDDAAEDLRNMCEDQIPNLDRGFARAISGYAHESRLLSRRVRDDADPDFVRKTYGVMGEKWSALLVSFSKVQGLPPPVAAQAVKVDGLHRRLGQVMNLPPFPPGVNPPMPDAKRFAFAVGTNVAHPHVVVFSDEKGTVAYSFFAYEKTADCGVRVDMADLNGDGVPELIVAPGPSKGNAVLPVKVFDGRDLHLLVEFVPFPGWKGGLQAVGAGLGKDGRSLVAVIPDGMQTLKVFDLAQGKEIVAFNVHDPKVVTGGVRLAWGDVNGDGVPDILTVNGPSNLPTTVKVFNGKDAQVLAEFLALDTKYKGGGFVAGVDFANNGQAVPVVGFDGGLLPLVRVYDLKGKPLVEWLAYDDKFHGGVRVAASRNHVVAGPGPGMKNSPLRIFDITRPKQPVSEIVPYPGFDGGVNVGGR
jgi:hypothetical protein